MEGVCDEISGELVAFLDGELADAERRPVAAHLSTCLGCRREIERLTSVRGWVSDLPSVEPSAGFAAEFWRRVEADPSIVAKPPGASRAWWWAAPALAAAAVVALAFQFLTGVTPLPSEPATPKARVIAAPPPAAPRPADVAAAPKVAPDEAPAALADAETLRPEDLPPELLEHPELFLRLPVVRRLEKLEHFDEVRQAPVDGSEGAG